MTGKQEIDLNTLPPLLRQVPEALLLPDPAPRHIIDSPLQAVARRLPEVPEDDIATALASLNSLQLTNVPYIRDNVSARITARPSEWITAEGLERLSGTDPDPGSAHLALGRFGRPRLREGSHLGSRRPETIAIMLMTEVVASAHSAASRKPAVRLCCRATARPRAERA